MSRDEEMAAEKKTAKAQAEEQGLEYVERIEMPDLTTPLTNVYDYTIGQTLPHSTAVFKNVFGVDREDGWHIVSNGNCDSLVESIEQDFLAPVAKIRIAPHYVIREAIEKQYGKKPILDGPLDYFTDFIAGDLEPDDE